MHKFLLTAKQLTPYNELPFSCKGSHLNDLENLASRIHQIIPRTLLFHALAAYNRAQIFFVLRKQVLEKYLNRFIFWR